VGTLKAKGVNADRKSCSPRLGVDAVGQPRTHRKNIHMLKDLKIQKTDRNTIIGQANRNRRCILAAGTFRD
jgi:hypothetical protein